jgi:uncharacterized membrane protein
MPTHNSWMMLSKFTTANRREAIAAAEMRASATMRNKDAVFATVVGERSAGNEYATGMAAGTYTRSRVDDGLKALKWGEKGTCTSDFT